METNPGWDIWYVSKVTGRPVHWDTTYTGDYDKVLAKLEENGFAACKVPHGSPPPPQPWPTSQPTSTTS